MFIDHIRIHARAGNGGDGAVSFRREKYIPRGGPDGGDGGDGGSVILKVDSHTDNLRQFFYDPNLKAEHGQKGGFRRRTGKSGADRVFPVPQGTLVYRERTADVPDSGESNVETGGDLMASGGKSHAAGTDLNRPRKKPGDEDGGLDLIADLTEIGQEFVICRGGKGGRGNDHFKTPTHRTPYEFTPGEKGEEGHFFLELRQIADAGFVGFPNAGKSSLLGVLSAARPKIAAYPFTTLHPMIGVIEYPEYRRVRLADIPGLIEGAHRNVGLGHEFLRHILRCRILLFVVDAAGSEGRNPVDDIAVLRTEISLYDESLAKRPWLIVANKLDLPGAAAMVTQIKARFPKVKVIPVSAHVGSGLEALRAELLKRVHGAPAKKSRA
jgi:GTP-binding protein